MVFRDGTTALLPLAHPRHDILRYTAEHSLPWQSPIAAVLDAEGRVLDLMYTYRVTVHSVKDDEEDPNRLEVLFWGFCAVCYLTRDHPEFDRLRATLTDAIASDTPVVFANESWPVEGETEIWNRLLDVRPAKALEPTRPLNGAPERPAAAVEP
jgi:hypothetical protein